MVIDSMKKFEICIVFPNLRSKMLIQSFWKAQIVLLLGEKVTVPAKYLDFINNSAVEFLKWSNINRHGIKWEPNKQMSYGPIYNLGTEELKILKTFI